MDIVLDGPLGLPGARHGDEAVSGKYLRVKAAQQEELGEEGETGAVRGTTCCEWNRSVQASALPPSLQQSQRARGSQAFTAVVSLVWCQQQHSGS